MARVHPEGAVVKKVSMTDAEFHQASLIRARHAAELERTAAHLSACADAIHRIECCIQAEINNASLPLRNCAPPLATMKTACISEWADSKRASLAYCLQRSRKA